jgi:ubiquinol oxidase
MTDHSSKEAKKDTTKLATVEAKDTTEPPTSVYYNEIEYEDYFDGNRPGNAFELAVANFQRQGKTIFKQAAETIGLKEADPLKPPQALGLSLSNEAVAETERLREESDGKKNAHPVSQALYDLGCLFLDRLFDERPIQRFWFLEVIARIPYFSYVSMLHLYESLGWWRAVELRKVHNAEEWNELHHLLIMESLGGNAAWSDRFLGYHVAILYYWFLILVYMGSPRIAYEFMEILEAHAVDTYGTFVRTNRKRLKELPAPKVAVSYYTTGDLYLFDDFQQRPPGSRRPPCDSLLDVFENICQDEAEHVRTMQACQDYALLGDKVVSPHVQYPNMEEKRSLWEEWSASINGDTTEMDGF